MKAKKSFFILFIVLSMILINNARDSTQIYADTLPANEVEIQEYDMFDFEAFIKDSEIIDGTAPFDLNDEEGNDSEKNNGIVRSFDTITYPIKVTINPKKVDKLNNIVLKITGTLDNGITDNQVNARFAVGGTENFQTGVVNFEQTYTIEQTGNSVMIPVCIEVKGAVNGIKLKPKISVQVISVDGKDITTDKVISTFNNLVPIETSSKVNIKAYAGSGFTGQGIPYVPMSGVYSDTKDQSNLHAFAASFGVKPLEGKTDLRGATFPRGEIKYHIDLSGYVYWDGGPNKGKSIDLDFSKDDTPIYIFDEHPINYENNKLGSENTLSEAARYTWSYPNTYNAPMSNMASLDPKTIASESYRTVWGSGEWLVNKPSISTNKVTYTGSNKDYIIGSTFPEYRSDGYTGSKIYGTNDKVFSSNGFIFKMPNEYRIGEANNKKGYANNVYYKATVTLDSYVDSNGKTINVNNQASYTLSERNNPSGSYSVQTTLFSLSNKELGTPNIGWSTVSKGDASTILGNDVRYIAQLGSSVMSYGGYDAVFRWNTDSFELTKEYAKQAKEQILAHGYHDKSIKHVQNDTENQKVYYGIAKFTDNSFDCFTKKGKNDYVWYETYEDAIKYGEIGAIKSSVLVTTGPIWNVTGCFPLHVKTIKIGSLNENNTANIIVTNYYPYLDKERTKEIDVYGNATYKNPSIWSEAGELITKQTPVGTSINFETLAILNAETSSSITANKTTFYNSEEVDWTVKSSIVLPSTGAPDGFDGSIQVKQILPKGLDYKPGSGKQGDIVKEPKIIKNSDSTTTLIWEVLVMKDSNIDNITFATTINPFALSSGVQSSLTIKNIVSSDLDTREENLRTSSSTINILKVGMVGIYENIDEEQGEKNSSFTVRMNPYTTIEEEYDVKGISILPKNGDSFGSSYKGTAVLKNVVVSGGVLKESDNSTEVENKSGENVVSVYLNNSVIDTSDPHEIDLTQNGWYRYTGGSQDVSKASTILFHVEGILSNDDDVGISFTMQTQNNNFGDVYYNETTINSATDYKLSPVSNKVKYTIRADAELSLERIQIYTANYKNGLPVKVRVNKEIINGKAKTEKLKIVLYEKDKNKKVCEKEFTVESLAKENELLIPTEYLEKDINTSYEVRIEGYNTEKIYILKNADKIDTLGYTASEKELTMKAKNDETLSYEGVIMTEREVEKDMVKFCETLKVPTKEIGSIKSGYGIEINQTVDYSNEINLNKVIPADMQVIVDSEFVDGKYKIENNKTVIDLISSEILNDNILTQTLKFPSVFVEQKTGKIYTQEQKKECLEDIKYNLLEGGNKLYVPIWINALGDYNFTFQNKNKIGVNEISFKVEDKVNVKAYMFGHIGSKTIKDDEILIEPVDTENPFSEAIPKGWTLKDIEWLKK